MFNSVSVFTNIVYYNPENHAEGFSAIFITISLT